MNQLTKEFFKAEFPGWQPRQTFDVVWQNFWTNKEIPILSLDLGIDTASSCGWIEQNQDKFAMSWPQAQSNRLDQELGHGWFKEPHSVSRQELHVVDHRKEPRKNLLDDQPKHGFGPKPEIHQDAVPDLRAQLQDWGFDIVSMQIAILYPGGYLEPHRDTWMHANTMTSLWIPLNAAEYNLKIWPWGLLKHCVGSVYLLNNQSFIHAIANTTDQPRYVVVGNIDHKNTPPDLMAKIKQALKQQWFS